MSYYVHHVPGRLRVKIPAIRKNPRRAAEIRDILNIQGVFDLRINNVTGSTIVRYEADVVDAGVLLNLLKQNGYYEENKRVTMDSQIEKATAQATQKVGRAFFGWMVGRALEANGLGLLAAFI